MTDELDPARRQEQVLRVLTAKKLAAGEDVVATVVSSGAASPGIGSGAEGLTPPSSKRVSP
jgi:hypothetical protein